MGGRHFETSKARQAKEELNLIEQLQLKEPENPNVPKWQKLHSPTYVPTAPSTEIAQESDEWSEI